jgi:NADPH:quinone reductase-like Zn-dependent oxidoreductase
MRKFLYSDDPVAVAADLAALVRLVASGRLHPEIDRVRPWLETADVLQALLDRQVRGNAVLEIDHDG